MRKLKFFTSFKVKNIPYLAIYMSTQVAISITYFSNINYNKFQ